MGYFMNKWAVFRRLCAKIGILGALDYAFRSLWKRMFGCVVLKIDILDHFSFVSPSPFCDSSHAPSNADKSLNWIIPDFGIGSGGHLNIFRMISLLEKHGYRCTIAIDGPCQFSSAEAARESINRHFFPVEANVVIGREDLTPAWGTFATSWQTAYAVRDFKATTEKFYFVQDFEPYFYPRGSEYAFAERTYSFGFRGVTAGDWLAHKLAVEYGMKTCAFGFSYDRTLYSPSTKREDQKRVFFYARPVTPRRGFELGLMVLMEVYRQCPDVEFVLAGWDTSNYVVDIPHLNSGVVALEDLSDLYGQCDVALVLSFTNLSLLPIELMACGCPVVSNRGSNVEWVLNDENAVLAEMSIEDLSAAVVRLLGDTDGRRAIADAGLAYAHATNWDHEAAKVSQFIEEVRNGLH